MIFTERSFSINGGYIEVKLSYEDYARIADHIVTSRILTSTRTRPLLTNTNEIEFIIPNWIYKLRDELSETTDSLTGESYGYLKELGGSDLIEELSCIDRSVSLWADILKSSEDAYKALIYEDELSGLYVKDILPLCTALEFTLHIDPEFFLDQIWSLLD